MHFAYFGILVLVASVADVYGQVSTITFSSGSLDFEVNTVQVVKLLVQPPSNLSIDVQFLYQLNDNSEYKTNVQDVDNVIPQLPSLTIKSGAKESQDINITGLRAGRVVVTANGSVPNVNFDPAFVRISVVHALWIETLSSVIGWIYFVAWSISFYPQVILNWQRKSVVGLSFDFTVLNFIGHTSYALYNCFYYWDTNIQKQFLEVNPRGVVPVQLNDVLFSLHASLLTAVSIIQILIYERGGQRVSYVVVGLIIVIIVFYLAALIPTIIGAISWLLYLTFFSYVKLSITLIKYIPQAYLNYRRKSTEGWSIWNILLDFTGGTLSMLQMILISYNHDDWASMFIDLTKFALGLFSILFDILFMVQHYCLYSAASKSNKVHAIEDGETSSSHEVATSPNKKEKGNDDDDDENRPSTSHSVRSYNSNARVNDDRTVLLPS